MSESRRDLFKLSVLSALGLSSCAGVAREPMSGGSGFRSPSSKPRPDDVSNQGDIFVKGKMDSNGTTYWFLLQWNGLGNYAAYFTDHDFGKDQDGRENKPEVVSATSSASASYWKLVPGEKIVVNDGPPPNEIPVKESIVRRDCLQNLLGGNACKLAQNSWNEIN